MTDAGSGLERISHKNTITRRARSTRRENELISEHTPERCPKRSVYRLGSGGKVLVDAREDKELEVTAEEARGSC